MRRSVAHILVTLLMVSSLGAAPVPTQQVQRASGNVSKPKSKSSSPKTARRHRSAKKAFQVGRASWYGKRFHGKQTASGENYDMFQFTAAHRQLPLGSWVRVTNLRNARWVIVRVNDRGPIPPSRIIDLSYGAAQMLELRQKGVERVRLDVVTPETVAMNVGGVE
jgi:rare lipoprotein A